MRRDGYTRSLKCAQKCGRDRYGRSFVCQECARGLRGRGMVWCTKHGLQERKGRHQSCNICKTADAEARYDARYEIEPCANECGRKRRGKSDLCRACFDDLKDKRLGRCAQHGIQPLGRFNLNGTCRACSQAKLRDKHSKRRAEIVTPMLKSQGGECGICAASIDETTAKLDHDHSHSCSTGCDDCRRSLLCNRCNVLLGRFADDVVALRRMVGKLKYVTDDVLRSAIAYLEHWDAEMTQRGVKPPIIGDRWGHVLSELSYLAKEIA